MKWLNAVVPYFKSLICICFYIVFQSNNVIKTLLDNLKTDLGKERLDTGLGKENLNFRHLVSAP